MNNIGGKGIALWDEADEFFYDVLHLPDGETTPLRVRSLVGLIPLFAVETHRAGLLERAARFQAATGVVPRTTAPSWPAWSRAGTSRAAASGGCWRWCAGIA